MKVIRLYSHGELHPHDAPEPTPRAGEALSQVNAAGVRGLDLHWFTEGGIVDAQSKHPFVRGHEFAANTQEGKRVAVDPALTHGKCELCLKGYPNLCLQVKLAGHGT